MTTDAGSKEESRTKTQEEGCQEKGSQKEDREESGSEAKEEGCQEEGSQEADREEADREEAKEEIGPPKGQLAFRTSGKKC